MRSILPARPLRVRFTARLWAWVGVVMLVVMSLGAAFGAYYEIRAGGELLEEHRVWDHGVRAVGGEVRANRQAKLLPWLMAGYDGSVRYVDTNGTTHTGAFDFFTMLGGPDVESAELRYEADHPEKFATSWGIEASGARWRAIVALVLICGLCTWAALMGAWWIAKDGRKRAQVAKRGDEVVLRVISSVAIMDKKGQASGKLRYQLELDVNGEPKKITRVARPLLTCSPDGLRVVGLWIPDDTEHLIVVGRENLSPVVVSRAEWQEVMMRAAKASPAV